VFIVKKGILSLDSKKVSKSIFFVHKSAQFEALSRSTEDASLERAAGSGEWLDRECGAEGAADAEL
jgi:hypothetical protein